MLIAGEWQLCDDGVTRPMVRANVFGADGRPYAEDFLIDSGADRTVFNAALLARLKLPARSELPRAILRGIGVSPASEPCCGQSPAATFQINSIAARQGWPGL